MALVGPTAAGKTRVALEAARRAGATILSVDSMQVYRGMDIGTAKPSVSERAEIPHLMIDVVDPAIDFTVAEFQDMARTLLGECDTPVLLVGGSGLHLRAVIDPLEFPPADRAVRSELEHLSDDDLLTELLAYDPDAGSVVDLANRRRVVRAVEIARLTGATPTARACSPAADAVRRYEAYIPTTILGLDPGPALQGRVGDRVIEMRAAGFLDEVASLVGSMGRQAAQAVGYRELSQAIGGRMTVDEAFAAVARSTWALVKRQRTFFARDPRIRWLPDLESEGMIDTVVSALEETHE